MAHVVEDIELPKDWREFRLPPALQLRLNSLLDRLDSDGRLTANERREAKALTELVDVLALLKARCHPELGAGIRNAGGRGVR